MRERVLPVYEQELMAVVLAVQCWRPYLLGQKFVIRTDQRALKFYWNRELFNLNIRNG